MDESRGSVAYNGDVSDLSTVYSLDDGDIYDRVWMPVIAQWRPDHLVVAFGHHLRGKVDMGDICCSVSRDGGRSWQPPVTVLDHRQLHGTVRYAYANPVLFRPAGQDILWCFAMRCELHYPDSEDSRLCAAYSIDGGYSWQPVELAVGFHGGLITCGEIVAWPAAGGMRYLLPAHLNSARHDPHGRCDHFVLESDNLIAWRQAGYIPQPEDKPVFMHEGSIALGTTANELQIVMRTAEYPKGHAAIDPPVAYASQSLDGGRTWSPGAPEPALHNTVSKAYYGRDSLGRHLYVYSTGPAWQRLGLAYKVQSVEGAWGPERAFYDAGVHNSYPSLIEYAPGQYHAVWDSSQDAERHRTLIRYGRLRLD